MVSSVENNKRIAKNTMSLYLRQIIIMAVSIYSSRIVLNALGVVDYGIYNVVGGLIVLFGFLNSALAQATQRYIAYGIERESIIIQRRTFSMLINIHAILAIVIILICETLGLWFFYEKLVIPHDRLDSAFWVLQCSILTLSITVLQVPFNASIFGHEKMTAYAYISIVEALLKLCAVILLKYYFTDKLIAYGFLQVTVAFIIALTYRGYCKRKFQNCRYVFCWSTPLFKKLFSYTSWSLLGNLAYTLNNQGVNILINLFFGPVVNAARGIAVAIESAVSSFMYNFLGASIPAIIKSYASDNIDYMRHLSYKSSKIGFLLFMCLSMPLISVINPLLKVWLVTPPLLSEIFCVLSLLYVQTNSMNGTLQNVVQATGKVKNYSMSIGIINICALPIIYLIYSLGCSPESYLFVLMGASLINLIVGLIIINKMIPSYTIHDYLINVILRELLSIVIPLCFAFYFMNKDLSIINSILVIAIMIIISITCSFFIGLKASERIWIINMVQGKLLKLKQ